MQIHQLTYFVAVYTNPGSSGVVTQLPFMTAVNPTSEAVGVGLSAIAAFQSLGTDNGTVGPTPSRQALVRQVTALVASQGYNLVNATAVSPTVWVNVGIVSLAEAGVNETVARVASLLQTYGPGSVANTVYAWTDAAGNLNFGVLRVPAPGVTELYYLTVRP